MREDDRLYPVWKFTVPPATSRAPDYGLSAGIITTDADKGSALASRIEAGIVHINDQTVGDEPQMPSSGTLDGTEVGMPFDPFESVSLGQTSLAVTRLAFGGASIGGLYRPVAAKDAADMVDYAWSTGIRSIDVAPLYGYGASERAMGAALAGRPRAEFVLSTKVGRLVREAGDVRAGDEVDLQALGHRDDAFYANTDGRRVVFDFSADGVRRSVEASLERLGLDRVDILYIHDPDSHWRMALGEAYPALERLRSDGVVAAIGVGMNQSAMLARFAQETDMDVFLVANRYTLLDQQALPELLPLCLARGIAVVVGGVMNSGVLVDPQPGSHFDYGPAPAAVIARARRIGAVCDRYGVSRRAAAIQFPLAHPAVVGLIAGVRTRAHLDDYPESLRLSIPNELWEELRADGLIAADAPTPRLSARSAETADFDRATLRQARRETRPAVHAPGGLPEDLSALVVGQGRDHELDRIDDVGVARHQPADGPVAPEQQPRRPERLDGYIDGRT